MKPTLFILAAGMGSRYGGLKQLDGLGPSGETIMDYSVFDALRAGFGKIVFVIRHDFEQEFREKIISRYEGHVPIEVVFQDINSLPEEFKAPEDRTKPWGTGHAVLMGKDAIREPFGVINADDYYGRDSFKVLADFLRSMEGKKNCYCMVGFNINNTLSENGGVSRGLCFVNDEGYLTGVKECHGIERKNGQLIQIEDGREVPFPEDASVSMNMWGFTESMLPEIRDRFAAFLKENLPKNPLKCEYFLPFVVDELIREDKAEVTVLKSRDRWYGVTYREDKPVVVKAIQDLKDQGLYPQGLWE